MVGMRGKGLAAALVVLALLVGVQVAADRYRSLGRPFAGFMVMDNLLVAVGGGERGGLQPFDWVRAVDGHLLESGAQLQAEIARHPPGTRFHYLLNRRGWLVEADIASRPYTRHDLGRFMVEGLLSGLLYLALGALVFYLQPGVARSWAFLVFCLSWFLITVTYVDAHTTYRFTGLFMTSWALSPAIVVHLALTFPQRRPIVRRLPHVVWLPYLVSAGLAVALLVPVDPVQRLVLPGVGAAYWALSLILLLVALVRTSRGGATALARQRARVLAAGVAMAYLPAVLGTGIEALLRVPVPYLNWMWRLNVLFPTAVAYAMVRYNLFDPRAALRLGTIYSAVTGLVVAAYAGAIALLDVFFASLDLSASPLVPATISALGVVTLLNPVYVRTQKVVDRLFFRERLDVQQSLEQLAEVMTSLLDLRRITALIGLTIERLLHPTRQALLLRDEHRGGYAVVAEPDAEVAPALPLDGPLLRCLARFRNPITRERFEEDPELRPVRDDCLAEMETLAAELVVPVLFQERVIGLVVLGPKRSGAGYSSEDLRWLRALVNQSAVALENAKAYAALEAANAELKAAVRRVEILESIRANLSKFVPRTVQALIEQAPEAPELAKREADVSVLFVDIVGYTRLSERLEPDRVNRLVERYFGSFLDEVLKRGGDVNETAGDGFMVVFQDEDPRRHARAAVKAALGIVRRTHEINDKLAHLPGSAEPIALHIGVNSGVATVGATKIEGVTGTRWIYTASGPVTNVAARLAAAGEPDAILVGPITRQRIADEFAFDALGEQRLRNVEQPVPVFRLVEPVRVAAPS